MKKCLEKMAKHISENVFTKMVENAITNDDGISIQLAIDTYNAYQENERDGVDYIFDLDDTHDLRTCISGGLTAKEISNLYNASLCEGCTKFFMFGVNHSKPRILNKLGLKAALLGMAEEIIANMIMHPHSYDSIAYGIVVTDPLTCYTHGEL